MSIATYLRVPGARGFLEKNFYRCLTKAVMVWLFGYSHSAVLRLGTRSSIAYLLPQQTCKKPLDFLRDCGKIASRCVQVKKASFAV
jgi:hypothetical protein